MMSSSTTRWLICRICLKNENHELYSIFGQQEKTNDLGNLQEKIEIYGGIKVYPQNNLPNKICNRCLLLLRAAYKFRDLCEQSQLQLKQFINPAKEEDDDNTAQEQGESDCVILKSNAQDLAEYANDDKPTLVSIMDEEEDDEFENPANQLEEEEEEDQFAYEQLNETSQDANDFIADDSNTYSLDDNSIQFEYYDATPDEAKFDDDIDDEVGEPPRKTIKRKRARVSNTEIKMEDGGVYRCDFCNNVYQDKSKYALHIKIHKKVKPHECEICRKRFSTTPQLSRHMNSHTGNRPYKCQFCEASFGDPSTKIKHERIHTNERPYKCELCPKSFSYSNVLKVHMMVHTGEKPFRCAYCSKSFSQLHHKNAHEKRHRNIVVLSTEDNDVDIDEELKEYKIERHL